MNHRSLAFLGVGAIAIVATAFLTGPKKDREVDNIAASNVVLADNEDRLKLAEMENKKALLGDVDFRIYQFCHQATPTTKEHHKLCARVEDKLKTAQKKAKANPW